jgi:hypothetical protein
MATEEIAPAPCRIRVEHGLSSPAVRRHAEGNLQNALRETVGAQCEADQREIVAAAQLRGVHGENRQDEEQTEHAKAIHAGEARAGANFFAAHTVGGHGGVSADE